jgi:hypothetical protein
MVKILTEFAFLSVIEEVGALGGLLLLVGILFLFIALISSSPNCQVTPGQIAELELQTTVAVLKLGRATAEDVAAITWKARVVESAYLNQLCMMNVATKKRCRPKLFFWLTWGALSIERQSVDR